MRIKCGADHSQLMRWNLKNIVSIGGIVGCVVLSLLLFQTCENNSDLKRDLDSTKNFLDIEKDQRISRDSIHAQEMYEMEQNLMSEISARKLLEDEFERFKKITSHIRTEFVTRIDTFFIPYDPDSNDIINDYVDCVPIDTVRAHFIQTPKKVNYSDQWFEFSGIVDSSGLTIDTMSMVNKFDVTIGWKKPDKPFKFLRKKEPVVELISYSPYTKVSYVNNIVVDGKQGNFFTGKVLPAALGFAAGYGVAKIK
jgi:hypothetical protein